MPSLELGRLRADLVLCFCIVHKLVCIDIANMFEILTNDRARSHKFKLRAFKPRLDTRKYFFGYRIVSVWNDLPDWCVDAAS